MINYNSINASASITLSIQAYKYSVSDVKFTKFEDIKLSLPGRNRKVNYINRRILVKCIFNATAHNFFFTQNDITYCQNTKIYIHSIDFV